MSARVVLRIRYQRRSHLVLLLTLALFTATFLGYLLWERGEASAPGKEAPLAASAGMRRYYLTTTTHTGGDGAGVCQPGYHFASLWEILDTSGLLYDTVLGVTRVDSGHGPPSGVPIHGWVRTGNYSSGDASPGEGNCQGWSSSVDTDRGTIAALPARWDTGQDIHVWSSQTEPCDSTQRVWCVEDLLIRAYLPLVLKGA